MRFFHCLFDSLKNYEVCQIMTYIQRTKLPFNIYYANKFENFDDINIINYLRTILDISLI